MKLGGIGILGGGLAGIPIPAGLQPIQQAWLWDNRSTTINGSAPNTYIRTNYFGYTEYQLTGPQTLTVEAVVATAALAAQRNSVDIEVDGVYTTSLIFTVENTKQTQTFAVPSGTHKIRVVAGQETYVTAIQATGLILLPQRIARRIALLGASGTYGFNPSGMFADFSWYGQFRLTNRFGGGYNLSQSGFGLANWIGLAGSIPNLVNNIVAPCLDGAIENFFFGEFEAGQYEGNLSTPTQFGLDLAAFYDLLHTTFPLLRIAHQHAILLNNGNAPNGGGFLLSEYTTAARNVCNARSNIEQVEGLQFMGTVVSDLSFDNLHETQGVLTPSPGVGYGKAFNAVRQQIGDEAQMPVVVGAVVTMKLTNPAPNAPSIIGASTQAWWRTDAGITIGTTPLAQGSTPPAVTWAGTRLRQDVLTLKISTAGTGAAAKFDVYQDGGTTPVQSGLTCNASVSILNATNAPMVVSFPNQAFSADNVYRATVESWADSTGNGHVMSAPNIAAQPLLTLEAGGRRGVKGDGTNDELNSALVMPVNTVTASFVSGVVRIDTWVTGARIWGSTGGSGGFFAAVMLGTDPQIVMFSGVATPSQAGMVDGQFKRLDMLSAGGVGTDYLHSGGTAGTGLTAGATGSPVPNFNLFTSLAGFKGAATFFECVVSQGDPGNTKRTALDTYYAAEYGAGVLT